MLPVILSSDILKLKTAGLRKIKITVFLNRYKETSLTRHKTLRKI